MDGVGHAIIPFSHSCVFYGMRLLFLKRKQHMLNVIIKIIK
jgi:hypothetical protein